MVVLVGALLHGCTTFGYSNSRLGTPDEKAPQASFDIVKRPGKKVLVLLALSGGGSRAAYFSARTMLALERVPGPNGISVNVLKEVDLISSVSGGSLIAAYYTSSFDPGDPHAPRGRRPWEERTLASLMSRDYIARWVGNWFWPVNIAKFWFTAFDRTDIMAQTFADNFFDYTTTGLDLRMRDLNPARPNLVLNATIGNRTYDKELRAKIFGSVFTFTHEDFAAKLNSSIADYEVARAVMASATFPAGFNYMTLRDHHDHSDCADDALARCYVHVFDGGNSENLGLLSIKRVLLSNQGAVIKDYDRIVVILVDAYRHSLGANPRTANPRGLLDYIVDTNFLDATDSLLEANRQRLLEEFFGRSIAGYKDRDQCQRDNLPDHACITTRRSQEEMRQHLLEKLFFFHVAFDAVGSSVNDMTARSLKERLHSIPTTFGLGLGRWARLKRGWRICLRVETDRQRSACLVSPQSSRRRRKRPSQSGGTHGAGARRRRRSRSASGSRRRGDGARRVLADFMQACDREHGITS